MPYDINEMHRIQNDFKEMPAKAPSYADCNFYLHELRYADSRFKVYKNDGITGLTSDNIIHAGGDCLTHVTLPVTALNIHDTVP